MKPEELQMSRGIKFRAWDKESSEMVYNVNLNNGKPVKPGYQWFSPQNTVHDSEPMQYTGLHDKNEAEIYEGDILRFKDLTYKDAPERIGIVRFRNGSFCISTEFSVNYAWLNYERELLGNIYENPDLLQALEG